MAATTTKKHGIIITEGKTHNVKTVWNRGYRMVTYRRQPKRITFRSKLVNDKNQHLCGGWFFAGLENDNLHIERQLVAGRKPLGAMVFNTRAEAKACASRLKAAGLVVKVGPSFVHHHTLVEACQDIRVREIGDLSKLMDDYVASDACSEYHHVDEFWAQHDEHAGRHLKSYLGKKWDSPPCPLWVTGLILGYPVENTISIYAEAVS